MRSHHAISVYACNFNSTYFSENKIEFCKFGYQSSVLFSILSKTLVMINSSIIFKLLLNIIFRGVIGVRMDIHTDIQTDMGADGQ